MNRALRVTNQGLPAGDKKLLHGSCSVFREQGFTLIELILVVALVGALSLVVGSIFLGQDKIYQTQRMELGVTGDARQAVDDVDAFVRLADRLLSSYGGYTWDSQTLILQLPAIDSSGQIIPATFDYVVYDLTGMNLDRIVTANGASSRESTSKRLASRVSSLTFTYDSGNAALVQYVTTNLTTAESYAGVPDKSITLSSKSKLRNN